MCRLDLPEHGPECMAVWCVHELGEHDVTAAAMGDAPRRCPRPLGRRQYGQVRYRDDEPDSAGLDEGARSSGRQPTDTSVVDDTVTAGAQTGAEL